jgi:ElaB/YqjD/DUF883 family membrane-anchored ribosome-binding protein
MVPLGKWAQGCVERTQASSDVYETKRERTDMNVTELGSDLKRLVRDSEELLQATANAVGDKAEEVRERLSDTLKTAKRTCHRLEDKAVDSAKATDKVIREHPYQSIGAAFGLGLLIGVLVSRK